MRIRWWMRWPLEFFRTSRWVEYAEPDWSLFGGGSGYTTHDNTPLGDRFARYPVIITFTALALWILLYGSIALTINTLLGIIDFLLIIFTCSWRDIS